MSRPKKSFKSVLGQNTLTAVWDIMKATNLPDEFSRPPADIGSGKHGRISGSQWHTFFTVYLVMALIPLWSTASPRKQAMLDNFMNLVKAIKLATSRSVSLSELQDFTDSYNLFLDGMMELYPWAPYLPNHHITKHFPFFMKLWGPVFAYSTWIVERTNHLFQRMKTNMKRGMSPDCFQGMSVVKIEIKRWQAKWNEPCSIHIAIQQTSWHF